MTTEREAGARAPRTAIAAALFLLSGAAGLLYEVLWSRQLAHPLGGSYPAVVAVLTAFLGGLAAGAALGGRMAARIRRPLRAYALLEAGIAAWALLFPLLLDACSPLLGWFYRNLADQPALHTAARFAVAAALLLPPTVAMGATLPVLLRYVVAGGGSVLGGTGLLYGLNTLGAAGGALATGFWILPALGLRGTLFLGAAVNGAVALAAFLADRAGAGTAETASPEEAAGGGAPGAAAAAPAGDGPDPERRRRALLLAAAGSGAAAMVYQLSWTKALILSFGSSVHAFTLVVSTFILGLGVGGLLSPLVRARGARLLLVLAALEAGIGVAAWSGIGTLAGLPLDVIAGTPALRGDYGALLRWQSLQALRIVLLPTLLMGAAFPVLVAAVAGAAADASRSVGRVYGWNTGGTILGSLAGGMLLVPAAGIRGAILAAACLHLGIAALVAAAALPRGRGLLAAGGVLAAAAGMASTAPVLPPEGLVCGPYMYASAYNAAAEAQGRPVARVLRDLFWDMPWFSEGRTATVGIVRRPEGEVFLRINGKTDGGTGDLSTQVLLGQLPALARPGAERALVIGLATGISAAAVVSHGVERVDVVDICPEVVDACRIFDPVNDGLLRRPGVSVIVEDGRAHVEHAAATYDIIVTEPTNPWIAGVSNLFTEEYFRACRDRMSDDGVLCVWLQSYGISREDFAMVVRTVRSVFPRTTLWEAMPYVDFVLLASKDPDADLVARIAGAPFPTGDAARSLALGGFTTREALLSTLAMGEEAAAAFAGEGPLHTDDLLQLEFRTPRGAFGDAGYVPFRAHEMEGVLDATPVLRYARDAGDRAALEAAIGARRAIREGTGWFKRTGDPVTRTRFRESLSGDPEELARLASRLSPRDREEVVGLAGSLGAAGLDGDQLTRLMWARAVDLLEGALLASPGDLMGARRLAECLQARSEDASRRGDLPAAQQDLVRALRLRPGDAAILLSLARLHVTAAGEDKASPHFAEALRFFDGALRLNPQFEAALVEKGVALAMMERDAEAEACFRAVLAFRPDSVTALANGAQLLFYMKRDPEAREWVERGLAIEPAYAPLVQLRER